LTSENAPVTTTVTRRVKPGHEAFYEQFLEGIISAASEFPGHHPAARRSPAPAIRDRYHPVVR
jgi:antibiotic biosynthesis monooxygenase (ABM) superfamily enzyme